VESPCWSRGLVGGKAVGAPAESPLLKRLRLYAGDPVTPQRSIAAFLHAFSHLATKSTCCRPWLEFQLTRVAEVLAADQATADQNFNALQAWAARNSIQLWDSDHRAVRKSLGSDDLTPAQTPPQGLPSLLRSTWARLGRSENTVRLRASALSYQVCASPSFAANFGYSSEALSEALAAVAGGLLPWGMDVLAAVAASEADFYFVMQRLAGSLDRDLSRQGESAVARNAVETQPISIRVHGSGQVERQLECLLSVVVHEILRPAEQVDVLFTFQLLDPLIADEPWSTTANEREVLLHSQSQPASCCGVQGDSASAHPVLGEEAVERLSIVPPVATMQASSASKSASSSAVTWSSSDCDAPEGSFPAGRKSAQVNPGVATDAALSICCPTKIEPGLGDGSTWPKSCAGRPESASGTCCPCPPMSSLRIADEDLLSGPLDFERMEDWLWREMDESPAETGDVLPNRSESHEPM